ncbi:Thiosulfate sulfurtransferase/rhodanese-like domain-containing protein 3 [Trichinella pseudospiralis]|uniref:Thiosulfate sulfurtransferase/rhodanese-like domain-containing protein 3 n=1 Tax=Trichinella pseudospiralis TaxID=6337 RepID=A0A0V1JC77_TRIPS|nr:Thiosulfate sulfurtransferase/rhodanese-like domain-containing protein 3 [Trichinella pseudospiralis]
MELFKQEIFIITRKKWEEGSFMDMLKSSDLASVVILLRNQIKNIIKSRKLYNCSSVGSENRNYTEHSRNLSWRAYLSLSKNMKLCDYPALKWKPSSVIASQVITNPKRDVNLLTKSDGNFEIMSIRITDELNILKMSMIEWKPDEIANISMGLCSIFQLEPTVLNENQLLKSSHQFHTVSKPMEQFSAQKGDPSVLSGPPYQFDTDLDRAAEFLCFCTDNIILNYPKHVLQRSCIALTDENQLLLIIHREGFRLFVAQICLLNFATVIYDSALWYVTYIIHLRYASKMNSVALLNNFYIYYLMIVPVVRVLLRAFTLNRRSAWSRALLPATSKYRVEIGKVQKNYYGIHNSYELTYEELKALYDADDVLIIDVRDPEEIKKQGKIEGSYNVPLGQLSEALKLTPEAFRKQYHFEKPTKYDANIVFHGLSHIKSTAALEIAHKYGYKKSRHYPAGWEEWSKKFIDER